MGFLSLLFGTTRASIGGITIDASVSEEHVTSAEVTENPVEDGAKITDHVQLKPAELTIEGVISDTPLGYALIGNIQNFTRTITSLFGKDARSIDGYNKLLELQRRREPFTVVTGLKKYQNMIITDLSVPRTAQTGRAVHFHVKMREIRIAKSKTTGSSNLSPSVASLGSRTKNLGAKVTDAIPKVKPTNELPDSLTGASDPSLLFQAWGKILH